MSKYQAYSEYKDSGIEWVGRLPSHWKKSQLRYMFLLSKGLTITKANLEDEGIPCVNYGEVHSKYGFEVDPKIHPLKCVSEDYLLSSPNALLSKGDLVFADTSEDIEGSGNFTQLVSDEKVFAGYHTIIARPKDRIRNRYYAYLLDSVEVRTQVRHAVKGVKVFSITQEILRGINIWLPSFEESEKIASFLDHETAKIDTLIDKQQQLIQLLKEKRQAVISHAVTKGLNPNAPMRESGVEWLGEVPEHWKVAKVKYFATVQGGYAFNSDTYRDNGVQLLRIGNVYLNRLALERQPTFVDEQFVNMHPHFVIRKGDILMSLTGTLGKTDYGYAVHVDEKGPFMLNQRLAKIMPRGSKIAADYLIYAIRSDSYLTQLYSLPSGTKQANLSNDDVINIPIVVPPTIEEQLLVAQYISDALGKYDYLISKSEAAISLIQERRTALISAAVTGKIDVRHHVSRPTGNDTSEVSA